MYVFLRENGDRSADRPRVITESVFDGKTVSPVRGKALPR